MILSLYFLCVKTRKPNPLLKYAAGASLEIVEFCEVPLLGLEGPSHSIPHVSNISMALNRATGMQLLSLLNEKTQAWCFLVIFVNYYL